MEDVQFTIGSDPELFLSTMDESKLISSIGKFGGSKANPRPVLGGNGFAIQEDNVALEFNIPPAGDRRAFVDSLERMMAFVTQESARMGLKPALRASALFDKDQLKSKEARNFGCEPDYNAWTGAQNEVPHNVDKRLRSAGGHVHVGTGLPKLLVARSMDLHLGVPSVVLDPDTTRRALYGRAGAYRPTPYGLEYRVLSNFWLQRKKLMEWVYDKTQAAILYVVKNNKAENLLMEDSERIQQAINDSDQSLAHELISRYAL